jgi:hypothetical protein
MRNLVLAMSLTISSAICGAAFAEQADWQRYLQKPVYRGAPMSPIKIDYTGSCGGSYRCVNGQQISCSRNSRPAEFLNPYRCFCEFANTCR